MEAGMEFMLMPTHEMTPQALNLVYIVVCTVLALWIWRMVSLVYNIYELNVAISSGNIVRLPLDGSFGEMEMMWRSNMQQQLLRAKRVAPPISVQELLVPFDMNKTSLKLVEDEENGLLGIDFKYRSKCRIAVQMFWNLRVSAFQQTVSRFNHEYVGPDGRVSTHGRRKKRLFGQRYISVAASDRGSGSSSENLGMMRNGGTGPATGAEGESGRAGGPSGGQGPLFADADCSCRSGVTILEPSGQGDAGDAELDFSCPITATVQHSFNSIMSALEDAAAPTEEEEDQEGLDAVSPVRQHLDAPDGRQHREAQSNTASPFPASSLSTLPSAAPPTAQTQAQSQAQVAASQAPTDPVYRLVIAAKVLDMPSAEAAAASRDKEPEKISLLMLVVDIKEAGSRARGERGTCTLRRRVVVTSKAAYVTKELYGEHDESTQEECVICLSEPKDTALLPCRHLCVCEHCFSRLELCPVCRAPFTAYLRLPANKGDGEETDEGVEEASQPNQNAISLDAD